MNSFSVAFSFSLVIGMSVCQVILISATTGQRTEKLFESIDRSAKQFSRRIPTAVINEVVNDATMWMVSIICKNRLWFCFLDFDFLLFLLKYLIGAADCGL